MGITYWITRGSIAFALVAIVLSIAACSGNPLGREEVAGRVTLDGQPLDQGLISFEPTQRGEGRVGSGTTIKDGSYAIPAEKGLPPGEYLVRINSAVLRNGDQAGTQGAMPGAAGGMGMERIPPQFNARTKLSATIVDGGTNELNFELKSR